MATKFTPRMNAARAQMDGLRSTDPVVQAMLDATRRKREEEEKKRKEAAQAVSSSGSVGLNRAAAALPGAARLKSTDPVIQQLLGNKAKHDAALAAWDAQRGERQEAYKKELQAAGGYYATLPQKSDWAAYSAARGDVEDTKYRYINGTDGERLKISTAVAAPMSGKTDPYQQYRYLTDNEIKTYNYLYNRGKDSLMGTKAADEYLKSLSRELNSRESKKIEERNKEFADKAPVLSSITSVPANMIGGVQSAVDLGVQGAKKLFTGEDIDFNSKYQQIGKTAETIRGRVAENINNPVGKFLYQTGMSAADSLAAGMFGPLAGGVMLGTSSGASAARDAHERGASDGQALLMGVLAGTAEGLFERVSIGNLKGLKEVPVTGIKSIAKNVAKSMAVNASEEALTEIANTVTDLLVMGDMSNYALSVQDYVEQGMSEQEARNKAALDVAGQIALAGLAGGVMGTAFGGIGSVQSAFQNSRTGKAIAQTGNPQAVLDAGMGMAEGSDARKFAERLTAKQEAGQTLRNSEIGALHRENVMQIKNAQDTVTRLGKAFGRQVHFYEDADAEQGGYAENGEIYLNTRAPQQMMAQFFTHELTHTAENAEAYNLLAADIRERLGDSLAQMKQRKIERYAQKGTALTDAGAEAEVIADYVAKNLFTNESEIQRLAKRNRNVALRVLDRIREWSAKVNGDTEKEFLLRAQRLYEKAIRETRGTAGESERQNIIETFPDGRKYVKADRQVIMGNDPESWGEQVELYINRKIRNGENVALHTEDGDVLLLTGDTEGKASFRYYVRDKNGVLRPLTDKEYETKLNAETHIDELAKISKIKQKDVPDELGVHGEFAKYGWDYRTAFFEDFDGRYYKITISIAKNDDGKIVYNIGQIRESSKPSFNGSSDTITGARTGVAASVNSIPKTDANINTSGENVTQLQQSEKQMAYTDESDELFAKPVYSKPPLSKEDLEARYEAEKAYNREARESTLFSQAEESDDTEDLSDRDAVLEEFWAETHQEGPGDIERNTSNFGETSRQSRMSLQQRRALKLEWRILRRFWPVRERSPKKPILQEKNVRGERWLSLRGRPSRMQTLLPGICSTGEEKMGLTGRRKMQHMLWAKQ